MPLGSSELILNADRSIYHLNLQPEDLATTIITVGDPDRVPDVSKYFDSIRLKKGRREFITHTGTLNGKDLTVISTGIGTDNVDIVLNELDALANIDFETREIKKETTRLQFVRIGTSGAIQADIALDSFVISSYAMGFDALLHFYESQHVQCDEISQKFVADAKWPSTRSVPYVVKADEELVERLGSNRIRFGITSTKTGFYGPQGRQIRLEANTEDLISTLSAFRYENLRILNLEMETSGIYGLAALMGHQAISMNCILANRVTGGFSKTPERAIGQLIEYTLEKLTQ